MPQYDVRQNPTTGNYELRIDGQLVSTGTEQAVRAQLPIGQGSGSGMAPTATLSGQRSPSIIGTSNVQRDILQPIREAITPRTSDQNSQGGVIRPQTSEDLLFDEQRRSTQSDFDRQIEQSNQYWDSVKPLFDEARNSQINLIKSQYAELKRKQEEANKRRVRLQETIGVRFGGRFTPEHTADLVQEQVDIGIQKINELNAEESARIAQIQQSFADKEYSLAVKKFDELQEIRKERDKKLDEITKEQLAALKVQRENEKSLQKQEIIADLYENGATTFSDIIAGLTEQGLAVTDDDRALIDKMIGDIEEKNLGQDYELFKELSNDEGFQKKYGELSKYEQYLAFKKDQKGEDKEKVNRGFAKQLRFDPLTGEAFVFDPNTGAFSNDSNVVERTETEQGANILNSANSVARRLGVTQGKQFVQQIKQKLDGGDFDGAMQDVLTEAELSLSGPDKEDFRLNFESTQGFMNALDELDTADFSTGPYKALAEKTKPWLLIQKDPAFAQLNAKISQATARLKRGFYGTAITPTESADANKWLVQESDQLPIIRMKLAASVAFLNFANDTLLARQMGAPKPNLRDYYEQYGVTQEGGVKPVIFENPETDERMEFTDLTEEEIDQLIDEGWIISE